MAESTFGRLAVNDGKLVSRLRFGGRVRGKTVDRVRAFMTRQKEVDGVTRRIRPQMAVSEPMSAPAPMPITETTESSDKNFRFYENPASVLVLTNMYYSEAPWLTPNSVTAATSLVWHEQSLLGNTAHEFEQQITDLQGFLAQNWRAKVSKVSGNPIYEKPVVL